MKPSHPQAFRAGPLDITVQWDEFRVHHPPVHAHNVTGYDHGMAAEASWAGGHCRFRLEPPPPDDPLPDMGTVKCHAVGAITVSNP